MCGGRLGGGGGGVCGADDIHIVACTCPITIHSLADSYPCVVLFLSH